MALSNCNKEVATRLFQMLSKRESHDIVKKNHACYGKLCMLADQMSMLQQQAKLIIEECEKNEHLHNISKDFHKVPGQIYYHYTQNGKEVISLISNIEWQMYETYHGKYVYDYDYIFRECE